MVVDVMIGLIGLCYGRAFFNKKLSDVELRIERFSFLC